MALRKKSVVSSNSECLLWVDLDGTLLASDVLWESVLVLLRKEPLKLFILPIWMFKGKAYCKRRIAERVDLDPELLPYRDGVLSFLRQERTRGRELILATASDRRVAEKIASHLGIFSEVLASDGAVNLSGAAKLEVIEDYIGEHPFDYIGNDTVDLPLWRAAHHSLLVHPTSRLLKRAREQAQVTRVFPSERDRLKSVFKALRVQQWVKNLLLFIPLLTAHKIADLGLDVRALYAFLAFSFCASGVYIINDLFDLESDRQHPRKRNRPFASGALQIKTGLAMTTLLLAMAGITAGFLLPPSFCVALFLYFIITTAYSHFLKRIATIDVLILAGLYTLRVLAGGLAVEITVSPWLLAFSIFLFLSLAFVKRYSELHMLHTNGQMNARGRGYSIEDKELLRSIGPVSGYLSVLVLALYINSPEVRLLYHRPILLWLIGPCLLYWITRIWFLANRGGMDDDPIVFTVTDPASYVIGIITGIVIVVAAL